MTAEHGNIMKYSTPEEVGISSENILKFVKKLEEKHFAVHDVILARGNRICYEAYWEPFHREYLHRMYSVSKSFVGIAIGFLEQDGLLDLDDKISKYFSKELKNQPDQNQHNQTIRHMLMMSTAKRASSWFADNTPDRVVHYFSNPGIETRPSGTFFEYDSTGSFILGTLVERVTGKPFMEYMREKLFREIGISEDAYCLKCPGGHSWTDSGIMCRAMDLLLLARFVLNGGSWNGRQILNKAYIQKATSHQISNNLMDLNLYNTQGYGYQIWRTWQDSFFFYGIGTQYAICVPHKDLILVVNGGTHGKEYALDPVLFDAFFEIIVDTTSEEFDIEVAEVGHAATEKMAGYLSLEAYSKHLKLLTAQGKQHSEWENRVQDITYEMQPNSMHISKIRVAFEGDTGTLYYTNKQGDKALQFGLGYNVFGLFPEEDYPDETGNIPEPGNHYECAASAAWVEPHKLHIAVQIIGRYYGNLSINLAFSDGEVGVFMTKAAEYFLMEYMGFGKGIAKRGDW